MTPTGIRKCRACPCLIAPGDACKRSPELREQYAPHWGRGLCRICYRRERSAGHLDDYPRSTRARDELLDEWEFLHGTGVGIVEAAPRLGMSVAALTRALERARKDGDPRARFTWHGYHAHQRQRAA